MSKEYNLLELFKGTGSVSKVASEKFNIVSLDVIEKYKPDINTDILKWDYKKFYEDTGFIPDLIWASPPCNTFSRLSYIFKERVINTAEPLSARAKLGTKILYRTLAIINFFKKINPKLLYIIENPKGMMRNDKRMKKLPYMDTTHYCLYGDARQKTTDFWSNFQLDLKKGNPDDCFKNGRKKLLIEQTKNIEERYYIPSQLVSDMLDKFYTISNKN
jgi:site-specific DNA-cytosine methylase